jgi:hypothetical protein
MTTGRLVVVDTYRFGQKEEVVLGLDTQVLEDGVGPEPFHVIL